MTWKRIISNISGTGTGTSNDSNGTLSGPPSPRHSHSVVIYKDSMFLFGGYDGYVILCYIVLCHDEASFFSWCSLEGKGFGFAMINCIRFLLFC